MKSTFCIENFKECREMKKEKQKNPNRLSVGKFFAWKTRDVSLAAITVIISGYLMMFCTDTLGMSAALVGSLMMASKIFDGITDIFAGYIVDNTNTKLGKGRPYEIAIIFAWLSTVLLFFADESWSMTAKSIWVFTMYSFVYSIFSTLLTACGTPYTVRAFSGNRVVITKVASYGGIVSMGGSIIVSLLFPRMMAKLVISANGGSDGWRQLIVMFAIPLAFIGILRFIFVKEDPSIDAGKSPHISIKEAGQMIRMNKYAWSLAGVVGIYNMVVGFGAGSYYFRYIVGDISAFGLVGVLGMLLLPVMFIFPALIRKLGVSKLFIISGILAAAGYLLVFFAKDNMAMLYSGIIMSTIVSLPISYLQVPCIMDLSTYNEYKGMHRMEGTTTVVINFVTKILSGLGAGLAGVLLGASGFVSTTGSETVVQPDSAIFMIRGLYSLIPLICMILIILCAFYFGRLEKKMPEIEKVVKEKKEAMTN